MQALYQQVSEMLVRMEQRQREMDRMLEKATEDSRLSTCDDLSQLLTSWKEIHGRLRNIDSMMSECLDIEDIRKEKSNLVNAIQMLKTQLSDTRRQYNDSIRNSKKSSNNNSLMLDSNNILDGMKQDDTISLTLNDNDRKRKEIEQLQKEVDRLQRENERLSTELVHQSQPDHDPHEHPHANSPPVSFEPKSRDLYDKQPRSSRDPHEDSANTFKGPNQTFDQHKSLLALAQYISGGSQPAREQAEQPSEEGKELPRFFQPRVRGSVNPNLVKKKDLKIETETTPQLPEESYKQTPESLNLPPTPPRSTKTAPQLPDDRRRSDEELKVQVLLNLKKNPGYDQLVDRIKEKDANVGEIKKMLLTIEEKIELLRKENSTLNTMILQQDEDQERIRRDVLAAQQEMASLQELVRDLQALVRPDDPDAGLSRSEDQVKIHSTGKKLAESSHLASELDLDALDSGQLAQLLASLKQEKMSVIDKFKRLIAVSNLEKSHMKEKLESILAITNRFNQQLSNF